MAATHGGFKYPSARRDAAVSDEYHGTSISDPYRQFEDPDAAETAAFVDAQNVVTQEYIQKYGARSSIVKRMLESYNYPKFGCPFSRGGRYYQYKNSGLQNHHVLYQSDSLKGEQRVFLDPNSMAKDGTTALSTLSFSEDGAFAAYGISAAGSDWVTIKIRDATTREDLVDKLEWIKFSGIEWSHDNKGFFYSRYPAPASVVGAEEIKRGTETQGLKNHMLYYHVMGDPQEKDRLIFSLPDEPDMMFGGEVTDDGNHLIIGINNSCDPVNKVYLATIQDVLALPSGNTTPVAVVKLIDTLDAGYDYILNNGPVFYFKTNKNAPRYKLIAVDIGNADPANWREIFPQGDDVLSSVRCVNENKLITLHIHDCREVLNMFDLEGRLVKDLGPEVGGQITSISGRRKDNELFYSFQSWVYPGTIYRYDFATQTTVVHDQVVVNGVDVSGFETKQVFVPGKDGTRISTWIVHNKGLELNGENPTLLYGYGGFNISLLPSFSVFRLLFVQHFRGILAVANIRGGGEYGEEWHKAGSLGQKQNCFNDFCAAAEYLIAHKYTSAHKLAIQGGSNGGLLVAACANQRPELFGAAIAQVGVLDMLRFHKFSIGYAWCSDYGSSDTKEGFDWQIKYSPLHNVPNSKPYPALLLTTGDHDDRVVPLHSLKFIATIQNELGDKPFQKNPLMIRIECKAGHGAGKPTEKIIEEYADIYAFIGQSLGLAWVVDPEVIYEVNCTVDADAVDAFVAFLQQKHVGDMLSHDGFLEGRVTRFYPEDIGETSAPGKGYVTSVYRVASKAHLLDYIKNKSAPVRQEMLDKFPGKFSATRRILVVQSAHTRK